MKRLKKVDGHYLDLSPYNVYEHFDVYELGSYDFSDNIDFGDDAGVYIFTHRDVDSSIPEEYNKNVYQHELIYCGMTEELDKRFYAHFHAPDIIERNGNRLSIYKCKDKKEASTLEKKVLSKLKFPVNKKDNDNPDFPTVKKVVEAF